MKVWKSITNPNGRDMSIAIQGEQLQIVAVNDAELFEVFLYPKKAKPMSDVALDTFVKEMQADLAKVGGVTFPTFSKRPHPK